MSVPVRAAPLSEDVADCLPHDQVAAGTPRLAVPGASRAGEARGGGAAYPLPVLQIMRHPLPTGGHSVEGLFETVRAHMPESVRVTVATAPRLSSGIPNRVANLLWARRARWPVTHVTGDVTYLAASLPRRRGSILTILDTGWASRSRLGQAAFDWLWLRMPVARAERVTVISAAVRDAVVDVTGCAPERVEVIPCCVHPDFGPPPEPRARTGRPVVLQVGTTANKNLPRVAAALEGMECDLRIIGQVGDDQRAALARHRVRYRASADVTRAEVVRAYQEADALVFASTFEGFGMPILEAQASDCPVVTSDLSPMREVAGGAATLVDPFDVDALRAGLRRTIEDDAYRGALLAAGRRNVAAYRAGAIAVRYAALYQAVAAGRVA